MSTPNPHPHSDNPLDCRCVFNTSRQPGQSTRTERHTNPQCPVHGANPLTCPDPRCMRTRYTEYELSRHMRRTHSEVFTVDGHTAALIREGQVTGYSISGDDLPGEPEEERE